MLFVFNAFYKTLNSLINVHTVELRIWKLSEMTNLFRLKKNNYNRIMIRMMNLVMYVEEMMTLIICSSVNIVKVPSVIHTVITGYKVMFLHNRAGIA